MAKTSPTLQVLMEIREVLKQHDGRLEAIYGRLEGIDGRLEGVDRRKTKSESGVASELGNVARAMTEVRDLLRDRLDDRDRIDALDQRVSVLERRAPAE